MKFKNYILFSILCCAFILWTNKVNAQTKNDSAITEQKDVNDIVFKVFKKKISEMPDSLNVKPGKPFFSIVPGVGYTLVTGLDFVTSANLSFYTGKNTDTYLSVIESISEFSFFNHQIIIPIWSNVWTKGNKYNLLGDWRYYKYPTNTYGLGGHSLLSNAELIDYSYIRVYQEVLKKIHSNFFAGAGYNLDYHYNIKELGTGDFQQYNKYATRTISSGIALHLKYDTRKNVNNPLKGLYSSITYRTNSTYLGSDKNWQSLIIDFRNYIKLSSRSNNVLVFWTYNWFTFGGKTPYFDLPSTGWDTGDDLGRGYIQGRFRGTNMVYLESEYRFGITRNGLIGGVVFVNAQSVSEINTNKFETILPAYGGGLRFKVNKYSRVNFCVDYGIGIQGSRGFFFNLGEVF